MASFFRVEVIVVKLWPGYIGKEWRNMVAQNCGRKKGPVQADVKSASFFMAEWRGYIPLKHRNPPLKLRSVTT